LSPHIDLVGAYSLRYVLRSRFTKSSVMVALLYVYKVGITGE